MRPDPILILLPTHILVSTCGPEPTSRCFRQCPLGTAEEPPKQAPRSHLAGVRAKPASRSHKGPEGRGLPAARAPAGRSAILSTGVATPDLGHNPGNTAIMSHKARENLLCLSIQDKRDLRKAVCDSYFMRT